MRNLVVFLFAAGFLASKACASSERVFSTGELYSELKQCDGNPTKLAAGNFSEAVGVVEDPNSVFFCLNAARSMTDALAQESMQNREKIVNGVTQIVRSLVRRFCQKQKPFLKQDVLQVQYTVLVRVVNDLNTRLGGSMQALVNMLEHKEKDCVFVRGDAPLEMVPMSEVFPRLGMWVHS